MKNTGLIAEAAIQIAKTPAEVFEAIVDPAKMKNYFISESSGKMEEGKILRWKFPEFDFSFDVKVDRISPGKYISFLWENEGKEYKG